LIPNREKTRRKMINFQREVGGGGVEEEVAVGQSVAPYGSWKSPISASLVASSTSLYSETQIDSAGSVYFLERRPEEQGRYVILRFRPKDGEIEQLTPPGFNIRTRVHEYGGGSYLALNDATYFSNFSDQRVYRLALKNGNPETPEAITSGSEFFYADFEFDQKRNKIFCIREDHSIKGKEATNEIVSLDPSGRSGSRVVVSGNDFYSSPRLSPDGSRLAWLTWNHPNMPFFSSELWLGKLGKDGRITEQEKVAGGPDESVSEPRWSRDGVLHFVSDRSGGWWNIHRLSPDNKVEPVYEMDAEFTLPHWVFGISSYSFLEEAKGKTKIICSYSRNGTGHLAILDEETRTLQDVVSSYSEFSYLKSRGSLAYFMAASPSEPTSLVSFDVHSQKFRVLARPRADQEVLPGYISHPKPIDFPTVGGLMAHALYYEPKNRDYRASEGERPPLIVISHGGPTSATTTRLNLMVQFWTSRGFGVLDVNYGGSTGYGREYRMRLKGQWGIVDVEDCLNGALFVAREGMADEKRLIIRGGSAGGYTTLCALAFKPGAFKAGASYFGLSDLEIFVRDTHKFESRYLEHLVGKYPEERDLYRERSPINHVDKISSPVIFFQGDEDKIVPPNQAEIMYEALRKKRIPTAYLLFQGEQHGFRQAKTIIRAYEAGLYFYSKVFGFSIADQVGPVEIQNL
jgi:dipeptidyl aminopeptidase/acylaminoacyl peptidase